MLRVLALAALLALAACGRPPVEFANTDITGADYAKDFSLTDHTGRPRSLADFRGKAVAVFFGFTHCPDVCPTAMAGMAQAMQLLGADAGRVQVLFITVDPARDTAALLAQYVPAFHPSFIGLTGEPAAIERTAKDFKVFFQRQSGATAESYSIDHSAGIYLYDPQGRLRLYVRHGETPDKIAADLKKLLAGA
jgi:protein SCO1/2